MDELPGGIVYLADSSAWVHARIANISGAWDKALSAGQIAKCAIVVLELLTSARDGDEFDLRAAELAELRDVPISRSVTSAALGAYRALAHRHSLFHRSVKLPDLLVAAAAADVGIGVLHYDTDYDTLATVLPFESRWIAPRGTLR